MTPEEYEGLVRYAVVVLRGLPPLGLEPEELVHEAWASEPWAPVHHLVVRLRHRAIELARVVYRRRSWLGPSLDHPMEGGDPLGDLLVRGPSLEAQVLVNLELQWVLYWALHDPDVALLVVTARDGSAKVMAGVLGVRPCTVRTRQTRARQRLRGVLPWRTSRTGHPRSGPAYITTLGG